MFPDDQRKSEHSVETVARDDQCPFGKWLYGDDSRGVRDSAHYSSCKTPHAEFHVAASEVLGLALRGERAQAEQKLGPGGKFARASAGVSKEILDWQKEQAASAREQAATCDVHSDGRIG